MEYGLGLRAGLKINRRVSPGHFEAFAGEGRFKSCFFTLHTFCRVVLC